MKNVIFGEIHHDMNREVSITFTAEELLRLTTCYGSLSPDKEKEALLDSGRIEKKELPKTNGMDLYDELCKVLDSLGFPETWGN